MARGAPDYSNVRAPEGLQRLDDMAELAVRLGSIHSHERGGYVIFLDDFGYGLRDWNIILSGTGASAILKTTHARSGSFSVELVGGTDASKTARIFRKVPFPTLTKYGLEQNWLFEAHTEQIGMKLVHHDGTQEYQFHLRYNLSTRDLDIRDTDGTWIVIDNNLYLAAQYAWFHVFKVVADLKTHQWEKVIVNNKAYDVSDYGAWVYAADDCENLRIEAFVYSEAGYNGKSYVDDIILTRDEH